MGALAALIFVGLGVALPALFAIGAGIALIVTNRDDKRGYLPGIAAVIFGIVGFLGTLGEISTEDGGFSFGISAAYGHAFTVIACIEVTGAAIYRNWGQLQPWLAIGSTVTRSAAAIIALVFANQLSNQGNWPAFVVFFLTLTAMVPSIQLMRE